MDWDDKAGRERWKESRIGGQFKVNNFGSDEDKILMGHATITDLSRYGLGLQVAQGHTPVMEPALFLDLPDTNDTLCIPEAYVPLIDGRRFAVELRTAMDKESVWLECLAGQR